jgi:hypothetical protein
VAADLSRERGHADVVVELQRRRLGRFQGFLIVSLRDRRDDPLVRVGLGDLSPAELERAADWALVLLADPAVWE